MTPDSLAFSTDAYRYKKMPISRCLHYSPNIWESGETSSDLRSLIFSVTDITRWNPKLSIGLNVYLFIRDYIFLPRLELSYSVLLGDPLNLSFFICNRSNSYMSHTILFIEGDSTHVDKTMETQQWIKASSAEVNATYNSWLNQRKQRLQWALYSF